MFNILYSILTYLTGLILYPISLFNPKIKLFVQGRKSVFKKLEQSVSSTDRVIWVHCASLGEFEQGLPIIERLKNDYQQHKIVVTFFSPSGYEVKKNSGVADVITYLPLDTKSNVKRFLNLVHPELVIFVKYEFWLNYLAELKNREIKTILVSGIFRPSQSFFKWHGQWMRQYLKAFDHFFVQNKQSKHLLESIGLRNTTIAGDTRYDRVSEILTRDNTLDFIGAFKQDRLTIVYGSSWEDDETIYIDFLNQTNNVKHIIAPHNIHAHKIEQLEQKITKKVVKYSTMEEKNLEEFDVFIIDTIGLLTKIYSYADIAYVGGAFKTGLHNILEPAVFGIPIVIGPKYNKFQEAVDLVARKGAYSINNQAAYQEIMQNLVSDASFRTTTGNINTNSVTENAGAINSIMHYIEKTTKHHLNN